MHTRTKIDLKKYLLYSLGATLGIMIFARSWPEIFAIALIYLATVVNQWMLMELIFIILRQDKNAPPPSKWKVLGLGFGKIIILFGAFYLGVQFMGNKIVLPLINYVIQIFILVLTIKKQD